MDEGYNPILPSTTMVTMTDYVRLWFRLVPAYAAGYFLSYGLRSVNAVIAPELMQELNISAAGLGRGIGCGQRCRRHSARP